MKTEYFDLVVVGAGPAGSITARTAALAGLDVLLVEKRQEIGDPVRCAEGVSKEGLCRHVSPDSRWISAEVRGSRLFAPNGLCVEMSEEMSGSEVGYVLERKVFDRMLAQEAAKAGAEVRVKTRATGLLLEDGQVRGVRIMHLGETWDVRARVVVGADGVESKIGRWAGIDTTLRPDEIESCAQFLVSNIEVSDYSEFYLGKNVSPSGYVWVFPKGENCANIGIGMLGSSPGRNAVSLLQRFVAKKYPRGKILEMVVGGVPVSGPLESCIRDGLMLVGDAARQSDPLTGGGIINAMDAGKIAGEVAAEAIKTGDTTTESLRRYEERWRAGMGAELQRSLTVKNFFLKLTDNDLNNLASSIQGMDVSKMTLFSLLKALFKANPRLLWEIRGIFKS